MSNLRLSYLQKVGGGGGIHPPSPPPPDLRQWVQQLELQRKKNITRNVLRITQRLSVKPRTEVPCSVQGASNTLLRTNTPKSYFWVVFSSSVIFRS